MHSDGDIFSNLEVQMGDIHSVVCSDCSNFLPFFDSLVEDDGSFVQVPVERIDHAYLIGFVLEDMSDDNDISPTHSQITGLYYDSVTYSTHRISKVGVAATSTVPVFTEVPIRPKPSRLVVAF